uniref:Uncharacterized protein n=1 Tax=Pristionchus pacificus TaxID=54126 RepID=A0A2A6B9I5_PRIPA|eukprot:PDM62539.1 hypothetical protein PRIPAC_51981 [Pristionchus pacificus]
MSELSIDELPQLSDANSIPCVVEETDTRRKILSMTELSNRQAYLSQSIIFVGLEAFETMPASAGCYGTTRSAEIDLASGCDVVVLLEVEVDSVVVLKHISKNKKNHEQTTSRVQARVFRYTLDLLSCSGFVEVEFVSVESTSGTVELGEGFTTCSGKFLAGVLHKSVSQQV